MIYRRFSVFFYFRYIQLSKVIATLETQLKQVGSELVEYRQKHGVKLSGEETSHATKENESRKPDSKAPGLLV